VTAKTVDHGPNCIACHDPEQARGLIAAERAGLDSEAACAAEHRKAGEDARQRYLTPGLTDEEFMQAQTLMRRELGTANAIQQGVNFQRAHLDRVEAAHPALRAQEGANYV
jgi:hypothetical protein